MQRDFREPQRQASLRARHVVYGGRWWAGLLRSAVVAVCYSVLISLAMLGLLAAAVMLR